MTHSAADRLRRLRLVLAALITAANVAGLVIVAWLVISTDHEQREERMNLSLNLVTETVRRLLVADGATGINTDRIDRDQLTDGCPQFVVLPAAAGMFDPKHSKNVCVPFDTATLQNHIDEVVRDSKFIYAEATAPDGRPVRYRIDPFQAQSGRDAGVIVAISDATGQEQDHRQMALLVAAGCLLLVGGIGVAAYVLSGRVMQPAAAALEQQERLLADSAHDLRSPIARLRALADAAIRNPELQPELLPRTVVLAAGMGDIIEGLLFRARLAAGVERLNLEPVALDQLVAGVVEDTPADDAQVTLTAAQSTVVVDATLVRRAIGNLLANAVRHGRMPDEPAVVHITVVGGRVTVADHGPGVPADEAAGLVDRFSSGGGSSGLGLSIVRWVAQAHGGRLSVFNADEGGAIFELELPEHR